MSERSSPSGRSLLALLIAAALGVAPSTPARAQNVTIEQPRQIDIPAGTLIDALEKLGDQSGIQILFETSLADGLTVSGLSGTYSVRAALTQLLSNSDLTIDSVNAKTVVLKRTKDSSRAAGDVAGGVEEVLVFGSLDDRLGIGSKSGQTLRETPKSITVLTGERIEAQQLTSLQDALIQTTGVSVAAFSPLNAYYYSRGIRLETLQFDGGAPAYTGNFGFYYTPDTATLERIEVLRGVDGMYSGAGEPGGVINLVRKAPKDVASLRVDLSGGRWDNYRGVVDVTGPIALDGRLRGRAVASYMDRGYFWDRYTTEKDIIYGVLDLDVTDDTLLTVGANYEKRNDDGYAGYNGFPRYSDGTNLGLPRSYNVAPEWARWHTKTQEVFGKLEQGYGETGKLRLNVSQIEQESTMRQVIANGTVDVVTLDGPVMYGSAADYESVQRLLDLSASGKFQLFGRTHSYTVGADYAKVDGGGLRDYLAPGFNWSDPIAFDFFNDDPALTPEPALTLTSRYPIFEQWQRGIYATVGLQLAEPLRLTLGGRHGKYNYHRVIETVATGARSVLRYTEEAFIPSAALSYTLSEQWTAYLSYGENFKSQANLLAPPYPGGASLDPITGDNLELGIKGEIFQRVNAALAVYQLTRDGQGARDTSAPSASNPMDGSSCCYISQGEITVKGVDLELSGEVLPDWQVFSGYTFTETDFEGSATGSSTLGRTPKHQLKVWSTWRLPGRFDALTLNAGVLAQSKTFFDTISYGGQALWNASVQYQLTDHWTIALYGDNLTDKVYYLPTGTVANQNVYGTPRSVSVSVRGHW